MTETELKKLLAAILAEEESSAVDWTRIESLSLDLIERLIEEPAMVCPHGVYHFIDDFDIRQHDREYAERQRALVGNYLKSPNMA